MSKLKVAIIGLGFGKQFVPIYQAYHGSQLEVICSADTEQLSRIGDQFGVPRRYQKFDDVISDPEINAVHIVTPCEDHAWMSIAAMKAGKHVACTVPVGMSMEEIADVVAIQKETGQIFMMMETAVFTREFLYIRNLKDAGRLGRIQFVRGAHLQDMSMAGWSEFWNGLPPMWYATHCVGPCLEIVDNAGLAKSVRCQGSGRIREDYIEAYGSPFAFESAHVKVRNTDVVAEVSRFVHGVTRQYCETLDVYGSSASVEWRRKFDERLYLFDGGENAVLVDPPDAVDNLPDEIKSFSMRGASAGKDHVSFAQSGGHGGAYPHLVHEFISSIRERRKPMIDIVKAANWSAVGFCAHESAINGGDPVEIPDYEAV